jgi:hypothetical protein
MKYSTIVVCLFFVTFIDFSHNLLARFTNVILKQLEKAEETIRCFYVQVLRSCLNQYKSFLKRKLFFDVRTYGLNKILEKKS